MDQNAKKKENSSIAQFVSKKQELTATETYIELTLLKKTFVLSCSTYTLLQ